MIKYGILCPYIVFFKHLTKACRGKANTALGQCFVTSNNDFASCGVANEVTEKNLAFNLKKAVG